MELVQASGFDGHPAKPAEFRALHEIPERIRP